MLLLLNVTHPFYSSQFKVRRSLSVRIRIWVDVNERKYKCKKKTTCQVGLWTKSLIGPQFFDPFILRFSV